MIVSFDPARLHKARVLIVGDVMLDNFIYGDVNRISPEAPIPVLSYRSRKSMPGGAANVAQNVLSLGASATLIGVAGRDIGGTDLRRLLEGKRGGDRHCILDDDDRPTTVKTRYIAGSQQLLRVDEEEVYPISRRAEEAIVQAFTARLAECDVVAISDYGKGVLTDTTLAALIGLARQAGKPAIVDPKRSNFAGYKGCQIIKPNLSELARATQIACDTQDGIDRAARQLMAQTGAEILVTRSDKGMSFYSHDGETQHVAAAAQEVFDVSGAGDTALAAFASACAGGYGAQDAMIIANAASSVAVSKLGTATVTADEIATALFEGVFMEPRDHVLSFERAATLAQAWRDRGHKVGFTNGCFDILHAGHVSLMSKAAAGCDRLIVGLNSDASVKRLKGPTRPAQSEQSRAQVLASLDAVDAVVIFDEDTPLELIKALRPDVLIKGADYTEDKVVGGDLVKSYGGRVMLVDLVAGQSTTNTLKRVASQSQKA